MADTGSTPPRRRGRPPTVTPEKIVDAGIALTLRDLTVKDVATALGVSAVALHNHIDGIDGLRRMVAEEILRRIPPYPVRGGSLEDDLLDLARALADLVHSNPGIASYLARIDGRSIDGLARIDAHQTALARAYDLTPTESAWLCSTVAEHAIALAELVYGPDDGSTPPRQMARSERSDLVNLPLVKASGLSRRGRFETSMRATIVGALTLAGR